MALDADDLTRDRYGCALQVLHAVRMGWECGIEAQLPGTTGPHAAWLEADLACLGLPAIPAAPPLPLATIAQAWGARYVLEGSALGGRVLLRRVAPLGLTATSGARYFASYGDETGLLWRGFLTRMETEAGNPGEVVAGACDAFVALTGLAASRSPLKAGGSSQLRIVEDGMPQAVQRGP